MPRGTSKGTWRFCQGVFGKAGMTRHVESCAARAAAMAAGSGEQAGRGRLLHLVVAGHDAPEYWMHLEVPGEASLTSLDKFLRETWLECCGHLSAFEIAGVSYASTVDREWGSGDKGMRGTKVGKVLAPEQQCTYEYDFGTTTTLRLRVVGERDGPVGSKRVTILARNEPPTIPCVECGQAATVVCSQCIWDDSGWLCEACGKRHECGEEMFLPVVNSPRVGMCGYVG